MSFLSVRKCSIFSAVIMIFSAAAVAVETSEDVRPYDFKGLELGMTPSQFKAMLDIRPKYLHAPSGFSVTAVSACTGDERGQMLDLPAYLAENGAVRCGWVKGTTSYGAPVGVSVGNHGVSIYRFSFIPKGNDLEPRLFGMEFVVSSESFYGVKSGLVQRFGEPSDIDVGEVQNRMGASFINQTVRWDNEVSAITLHQRFGTVDEGFLEYRLNEYADFADSLKTAAEQRAGPDL